jgi:gliding motility-associated-like protein
MLKSFAALVVFLNAMLSPAPQPDNSPVTVIQPLPACTGTSGDNFLFNGDFGSGEENIFPFDPGLSPSYPYAFSGPPDLGTYTLTNNTSPWDGVADTWIDIEDNSPDPNGYMMVVDAAIDPGIFYEQTIDVCPNTTYEFSADIINIVEPLASPLLEPNVDFLIDGVPVLNTGDIPQDATWYNFAFLFSTAADQFTLTLALQNNASGDAGNDLALDNISFRTCGPEVNAELLSTDPICPGDSVMVSVTVGPEYPTPVVLWQVLDETGADWQDIAFTGDQLTATIGPIPNNGILRALVANDTDNLLSNFFCSIISNEINPVFQAIEDCFTAPITVTGDLCNGTLGENIFPDGDFGSGSDQFGPPLPPGTTTYIVQDTTWPNDGFYSILNFWDTDPCENFWPDPCWILPLEDNSDDPEGYVMAVNATWGETGIFYYSTISGLCENTTYQFSADIKNLNNTFFAPYNPGFPDEIILPNIDFIIGPEDAPIELLQVAPESYNTGDIINDGQWITYGFTFQTEPGVTDISFAIRNNAPGGGGNDFLLDNISFQVCGPTLDIFRSEICAGESVTLSAVIIGDQFDNPAIQWQESTDNGQSWADLPGQSNTALFLDTPIEGNQYRFLVAGSMENLSNPNCVVISIPDTITINQPSTFNLSTIICEGDSIIVGNEYFSQEGNYTVLLTTAAGCDSTVELSLFLTETFELNLVDTLCEGESITIGTNTYSQTGIYTDSLTSASGCDSIITLDLTVGAAYEIDRVEEICEGDSILIGNTIYDQSGNYTAILSSQDNCDSIIHLDLTVHPVYSIDRTETICEGESITLGNQVYDQTGSYTAMLSTANGCDSIITLDLTVNPSPDTSITAFICKSETYQVGNSIYNTTGLYSDTLSTVDGCDSIINLDLTVYPDYEITLDEMICEGEFVMVGNSIYSQTGNYMDSLLTSDGCDSVVFLNLTVSQSHLLNIGTSICEGESYIVGDSVYTETGTYSNMLTTVDGCDSTVNLVLTVRPTPTTMLTESICEGDSIRIGASVYKESGNYVDVLATVYGCDSTVMLDLSVIEAVTTQEEIALCPGDTYEGTVVTADSTITTIQTGSNGCDSTHVIFLNLSDLETIEISGANTFCEGSFSLLEGPAGFAAYNWSTGDTSAIIEADMAITYSLTVTDDLGCQAEASISLESTELSASFTSTDPSCFGSADGEIMVENIVGGTGDLSFLINGIESPLIGLSAGTYEISVIDEAGCQYSELVSLNNPPLLTIFLEEQVDIKISDSIELSPEFGFVPDSLVWSPATGLSCTDCPNPQATPFESTTYTLTAWDAEGCFVSAQITIEVDNSRFVYLPNAFSPNDDGLNDQFTVFGGQAVDQVVELLIFDRWGELVFQQTEFMPNDLKLGWDGKFNGKVMPVGVYTYFTQVRFKDESTLLFKGDVLLIR